MSKKQPRKEGDAENVSASEMNDAERVLIALAGPRDMAYFLGLAKRGVKEVTVSRLEYSMLLTLPETETSLLVGRGTSVCGMKVTVDP